ncbi:MAG: ABC transporter ATP-binding protein [Beijerinckiaceae bacterium]|nr:ABC transporter ATP-binding protein [Beijerinckiaceae bacterium]MBX9757789.1 ABC transporter ATP-binding protein [Beijerinckiaceae bacterium]
MDKPTSQAAPAKAFVDLSAVSLRYGDENGTLALSGVDLKIEKGQFAAIVGPSGCGKSSFMKLVTGLCPPTEGTIKVDDQLVKGPLKISGMAFQNPTLLPWRDTLGNTMLPLEIVQPHRSRLRSQKDRYVARAKELLATVGLAGFEAKQPWMLSGGMQQRASLCRALIHEPQLLMLDEPFAALDAFTREELWSVLQDLWIEKKFTCILVTHDLREAAFLADVVFVMSARPGRVISVHRIDMPRPRTIDSTFDPHFIEIVQQIRHEIAHVRKESRVAVMTPGAA